MIAYTLCIACGFSACGVKEPGSGDQLLKNPPVLVQPVIPIPTGHVGDENYTLFEWSPFGSVVRFGRRNDDGIYTEWAVGRVNGKRTIAPFAHTDSSKTTLITRRNSRKSATTGKGVEYKAFLADRWDWRFHVEATNTGPRLASRITYWLFDGVAFGIGVDSKTGFVFHIDRSFDDDAYGEVLLFWHIRTLIALDPLIRQVSAYLHTLRELFRSLLAE